MLAFLAGCSEAPLVAPAEEAEDRPQDTDTVEEAVPVPLVCGEEAVDGLPTLALEWCARVSPEPDQIWPRGESHEGDTDREPDIPEDLPRCGFFNSVGAVGLSERLDGAMLYCDGDAEGGLRFAFWDDTIGMARRSMLAPGECNAIVTSGALSTEADGWTAAWITLDESARPVLRAMPLDGKGRPAAQMSVVPVEDPLQVGFAGDVMLALGGDRRLVAIDGAQVPIASDVRAFAGAPLADGGGLVAVCDVHGWLRTVRFGPDLAILATEALPGMCAGQYPVGVAVAPDGSALVTWEDGDSAWMSLRGPEGGGDRVALGAMAAAAWAGDGWLLVTGDGHVRKLDPAGAVVAEYGHPALVAATLHSKGIRVATDGERASFVLIGTDVMTVGDHLYAYDFVELSSAALP